MLSPKVRNIGKMSSLTTNNQPSTGRLNQCNKARKMNEKHMKKRNKTIIIYRWHDFMQRKIPRNLQKKENHLKLNKLVQYGCRIQVNTLNQSQFFFFLSFCHFRAAPAAYGDSQARGLTRAVGAGLRQSHSNAESKPRLQPTPQFTAMPDP